ncbi:MAG: hypothetical protein FWB86_10230, partial [Treponema sp.]|nr:hypothetical protein [Treponema sp.]
SDIRVDGALVFDEHNQFPSYLKRDVVISSHYKHVFERVNGNRHFLWENNTLQSAMLEASPFGLAASTTP